MIVIAPSSCEFEEAATGWSAARKASTTGAAGRTQYDASTPVLKGTLNFDTPPVSDEKIAVLMQFRDGPGRGAVLNRNMSVTRR